MVDVLKSGWDALIDYFTINRVLSLIIAFFLSGAIASFMAKGAVLKYFGPKAKKGMSYLIASLSGAILAVCSCSVLPMFASIRKKGAGIGPAITFLFAGPAINILAITMTFSLIGVDIGIVRTIGAIFISIILGIVMFVLYNRSEVVDANHDMFQVEDETKRKGWQNLLFFLVLIAILVSGVKHPWLTLSLLVVLTIILFLWFKKDDLKIWVNETWGLAKKIFPLFIIGIFIAGMIGALISSEVMVSLVGKNTIFANLIASVFGTFMYFATLTEVPIVNTFISLGMLKGPATALLLAGPSLSLPNMIVISKVLGIKKSFTYFGLVIILSALIGFLTGILIY